MAKRNPFTWQQNFIRIPSGIRAKLANIDEDDLVVAAVKRIARSDIEAGRYAHLGIQATEGNIEFPGRVVPPPRIGRYSRYNVQGRVIRLKDLPKVTKTQDLEAPNFGDWSKGSHTVSWEREVYQRDDWPPKFLTIEISLVGEEVGEGNLLFKFQVEQVLNKRDPIFEQYLLYNLNLLQENTGVSDVFASDATLADYLGTIQVAWEILPPGERDENIARILSGTNASPQQRTAFTDRYDFLISLGPEKIIRGNSGFQRYFGAQFADDLVAFENVEYGNAIYVMFEDWVELSRRSRLELLSGPQDQFERVIHRSGWQRRLRRIIEQRRNGPR